MTYYDYRFTILSSAHSLNTDLIFEGKTHQLLDGVMKYAKDLFGKSLDMVPSIRCLAFQMIHGFAQSILSIGNLKIIN